MVDRLERFAGSVSLIFRCIQKLETEEMEKFGLKGSFVQYLLVMSRYEKGITAATLSKLCDKDKAAVSRALSEMHQKELICRKDGQALNYRALLTLTEKGRKVVRFVEERAAVAVSAASKGLSEAHRSIFYDTLDLYAANLKSICKTGIPEKNN